MNINKNPTSPQKVGASRAKKEAIIKRLSEKVAKAKAMVFTNYQGMTHIQLEKLKRDLKNTQTELVVAKNTLLNLSLEASNSKLQMPYLEGPTAILFIYDDLVAPLKELARSIKTLVLPRIKFGILDNTLLAEQEIVRLAALPSREVLIAQLIGSMKSPLYGLHRALNWNLQKFVMTLKAIEAKKTLIKRG